MVDLLRPRRWTFPVPITYGAGRISRVGSIARDAGMQKPLVVTDRASAELPFIAQIMGHLEEAGLGAGLFAEVAPNPRDTDVPSGCEDYQAGDHDGIIAVGGGSGMDGAKAIALTVLNDTPLEDFDFGKPAPQGVRFPPLITVPTTAGTGAETESTAMITATGPGTKYCAWHRDLKPAHTILDPELTLGLPPHLTAWTGLDALTHAIEAYSVDAFHPLCDGAALEGLRLIWRWLPEAVDNPGSLEARGGMLVGSCLAGVAFLKGLGIVHSISHMVGAEYDTHHGLTNAVVLPSVLRFNAPALADKSGPMAEAMGLEGRDITSIDAAVCGLLDRFEIPGTLADLGVTEDRIEPLATKAMGDLLTQTNPIIPTVDPMADVIRTAWSHGR
ncbi:MAG: iron-containing alcohol dehydrogenase [Pseudomonadota bacterium]